MAEFSEKEILDMCDTAIEGLSNITEQPTFIFLKYLKKELAAGVDKYYEEESRLINADLMMFLNLDNIVIGEGYSDEALQKFAEKTAQSIMLLIRGLTKEFGLSFALKAVKDVVAKYP